MSTNELFTCFECDINVHLFNSYRACVRTSYLELQLRLQITEPVEEYIFRAQSCTQGHHVYNIKLCVHNNYHLITALSWKHRIVVLCTGNDLMIAILNILLSNELSYAVDIYMCLQDN